MALPTVTPLAPQTPEQIARVLEAVRANGAAGVWDTGLAEVVGILDREPLRALLAELVIDGKITVEERSDAPLEFCWWGDKAAPWFVKLAPEGTPSLEDRIVEALAEAGMRGLRDDVLDDRLHDAIESANPGFGLIIPADVATAAEDRLIERGVIVYEDSGWYTLSPAEWARRIVHDVPVHITEHFTSSLASIVDIPEEALDAFRRDIERLLAGTESEPAASTHPASEAVTPMHMLDGVRVEGRAEFAGRAGFVERRHSLVWAIVAESTNEQIWEGDERSLRLGWTVPPATPSIDPAPPSSTLRTGEAPRGA